jgi:hypothetical protein
MNNAFERFGCHTVGRQGEKGTNVGFI